MGEKIVNLNSPHVVEVFNPDGLSHVEMPEVQAELNLENYVQGRADTLRNSILGFLVGGRYAIAKKELNTYATYKGKNPAYESATKGVFDHAQEIIDTMRELTENVELETLPRSKRQDTLFRTKRLFENMKHVLMRLEQIENDLLVEDVKSVIGFLRAASVCVFAVIVVVAISEAYTTLGRPMEVMAMEASQWFFNLINL